MNSRMLLAKTTSRSTPRGFEITYKPGFVDDKDLETIKMAVDKELSSISNAFYQISETISLSQSDYRKLYEDLESRIKALETSFTALDGRVSALESKP